MAMRGRRQKPPVVIAESRGARLVRKDGRVVCECPFACLATYEKCEFDPTDEPSPYETGSFPG